jgi:hypothetical protein
MIDFSKIAGTFVFITDGDAHYSRDGRVGGIVWGSESVGPLSAPIRYTDRCAAFVKLYDSRPHTGAVYIGLNNHRYKTNRVAGVNKKRGNQQFINKFTIHGKKTRSSKHYAKAVSMLLIAFKSGNITSDAVCALLASRLTYFDSPRLTVDSVRFSSFIAKNSSNTHGFAYTKLLYPSITNTELAFDRMQRVAPVYSFVLSKIDKARFKHSHGKAGRYEMKLKFIPQDKGVNYMFKYVKHA